MYIVDCYMVYLLITLTATVWVARTLHKNGRVFLIEAFHGDAAMANSVNHLLVVGFYLINLGYVAYALKVRDEVTNARGAIELVCDKIGVVLIVLGIMHFFNIFVFSRFRQHERTRPTSSPSGLQVS